MNALPLNSEKLLAVPLSPYENGQILFESGTPGTYELSVDYSSTCEISICGGGAGGYRDSGINAAYHYGGSAAAFCGTIRLKKGKYPIIVGHAGVYQRGSGGDSSIGDIIIAGGGTTSSGGTLILNQIPVSSIISLNGQPASGISLLGNGFGQGGRSSGVGATSGYVKIVYKG